MNFKAKSDAKSEIHESDTKNLSVTSFNYIRISRKKALVTKSFHCLFWCQNVSEVSKVDEDSNIYNNNLLLSFVCQLFLALRNIFGELHGSMSPALKSVHYYHS